MKVLLSIKPEFAEKIFEGEKQYEYRRAIFKNNKVNKIIVYASSPIQKVIGEFDVGEIMCEAIDLLWKRTKKYSGVSEDYFYKYFVDKCHGYAIKVKKYLKYERPLSLEKTFGLKPPQSFAYLE